MGSGNMEIGLGDGWALLGEEEGSEWISLGSLYKDKSSTLKQNSYPCLFSIFQIQLVSFNSNLSYYYAVGTSLWACNFVEVLNFRGRIWNMTMSPSSNSSSLLQLWRSHSYN